MEKPRNGEITLNVLFKTILTLGRFQFCPKFRLEIKGVDHLSSVQPGNLGPPLKVVQFDRSDRNGPFHLTKLLSPVPLFCILLATTTINCAVAWVGSVQTECTVPLRYGKNWQQKRCYLFYNISAKRVE